MKKYLPFVLVTALCISCLSSCDYIFNAVHREKELHEHTFEYIAYETGHFKQYTCGCPSPEIMEMHYDEDDGKCDACGYEMVEHKHVFGDWEYDEAGHWCSWECTTGMCELDTYAEHYDDDGDGLCDACDYDTAKNDTTLPDPDAIYLADFRTFLRELTVDEVAEIETVTEDLGAKTGTLKTYKTTTDKTTISRLLEKYKWVTMISTDENPWVDDAKVFTVKLTLSDGTIRLLRFNNGIYSESANHYKLDSMPDLTDGEYVVSYGFVSSYKTAMIFSDNPTISSGYYLNRICHIPLEELRFVLGSEDTSHDESWSEQNIIYGISTDFDKFIFHNPDSFYYYSYINGIDGYCTLIGKNINELIAEYEPKTDDVLLSYYEPWLNEITASSISQVRTISTAGWSYEELRNISSTTNQTLISGLIEDFKLVTVTKNYMKFEPAPGSFQVEFYLTDGSVKRIVFNGGGTLYNGDIVNVTPTLDRNNFRDVSRTYSFVSYGRLANVYYHDSFSSMTYGKNIGRINPEMFEFVLCECANQTEFGEASRYYHYFETDLGRVSVFSNNHLFIDGTIYEISNSSFADLSAMQTVKEARENKYNDGRVAFVEVYYGQYENGSIVAMISDDKTMYTEALWGETIAGYTFHYSDGNRIVVLYDGEFYTLPEAYENGYLTESDIYSIWKLSC